MAPVEEVGAVDVGEGYFGVLGDREEGVEGEGCVGEENVGVRRAGVVGDRGEGV